MEEIIDNLFGFLPSRGVLWGGIGIVVFIYTIQLVDKVLKKLVELPWMKEENQQQRNELLKKKNT
ncbi:hypothetical protein N0O92_11575 [Alkalihalobacillus sp. MEB130]|uniref:hypothetical protein n=1 Tax=Alkalihalobacillus sp. MEB130 TaxID=2976704 RepID=UPI0028DE76D8|nr:hypothetical protein [Alkalihalobacillus sp. MEB130]MDT8860871.1 hypothetical protein [Alkalihalobacillus sp. MEB130]